MSIAFFELKFKYIEAILEKSNVVNGKGLNFDLLVFLTFIILTIGFFVIF